ncbi:DUF3253 domain-containing protein [Terrihabitans sp. B22-R8]|uniref:DUF3253 domain-containing protein n=1 Tax=Terrihabitans sp. B22-R8 TaxID=3425128 RepID=UPI00403D270B
MSVSEEALEQTILRMTEERGAGKSICPSEAARSAGHAAEVDWLPLMQPVRKVAVRLAGDGKIAILRKGKPVDPDNFKGVYRLSLPRKE